MSNYPRRNAGRHQFVLGLTVASLLASGCGSTAYRDLVEDSAVATVTVTDPVTGETMVVPADPQSAEQVAASGDAGASTDGYGAASTSSTTSGATTTDGAAGTDSSPVAGGSSGSDSTGSPSTGSPTTDRGSTGSTGSTGTGGSINPELPPVKVGFIQIQTTREFQSALGFSASDLGPLPEIAQSLADHLNADGGLGGRKVEVVMQDYFMEEASPSREAEICVSMADDNGVEVMVFQGQIHGSTRFCYAGKGVLMFDPAPFVFDDDLYAEVAPYYWSPSYPSYDRLIRALVPNLVSRDFFEPMTSRVETEAIVGVLHWDSVAETRVLNQDMLPALASVGIDPATVVTHAVDPTNAGTIQTGLGNAVVRFRNEGVNRVLFIGGSPLAPFFYLNADQGGYRPRYGLTTLDAPRHTEDSQTNARQMDDAIGIGFAPVNDVTDHAYPFPSSNAQEQLCMAITKDTHEYTTRANAQAMLAYCESMLLLQAGSKVQSAPFTAEGWAVGAEKLGKFQAATNFSSSFGVRKHDGADVYRNIVHHVVCPNQNAPGSSCFVYDGGEVRF
ncbi:MAG: hypothetical protein ACI867_001909 [Glaciecola sp.]|jgi:hypothetical protein